MHTLCSPVLHMTLDDAGLLTYFGAPDGENLLASPCPFVTLDTGAGTLLPRALRRSEEYLCFAFADGSLFYLLPEISYRGLIFDTAGFFPADGLTDRLGEELPGVRVRFGLPEGIAGAAGVELNTACPGVHAVTDRSDGFMGARLALTLTAGHDPMSAAQALLMELV